LIAASRAHHACRVEPLLLIFSPSSRSNCVIREIAMQVGRPHRLSALSDARHWYSASLVKINGRKPRDSENTPRLAATLETIMMSLFGLLVWVPSFFMHPRPSWATPPANEWSELVVSLMLAASAWIVATSLSNRPWGFGRSPPAVIKTSHSLKN